MQESSVIHYFLLRGKTCLLLLDLWLECSAIYCFLLCGKLSVSHCFLLCGKSLPLSTASWQEFL